VLPKPEEISQRPEKSTPSMNLTVILCTYNRCRVLATALESVAASILPPSVDWEVLVVDNNSNDQTHEVIQDFCRRYPGRFRYLFEPQPGKSYALNSGVREAQGEILAFLDDDATVEPTSLRNLTAALEGPEWAGAGGRIILQWPASLPNWLSVDGPYSRHPFPGFDKGNEAKELIGPSFGANMAFRKEMFEKHGAFRFDLGPSPNADIPPSCEDTEFGRRLIAAGERLRYEPSAVVYHPVSESRIDKKYFLQWWYDYGRADARVFQIRPVREFCSLVAWTLRWLVALEPRARFYRKLGVWEKVGKLVEFRRQSPDAKKRKDAAIKVPKSECHV
jgi:glycosyltransferase involved in cell wall biosynthesis